MTEPYIIKPLAITQDKRLSFAEQDYVCLIGQLSKADGVCVASNGWFSRYFNTTKQRASEVVCSLASKKIISVKLERKGKRIIGRTLEIADKGIKKALVGVSRNSLEGYQGKGGEGIKDLPKDNKEENKGKINKDDFSGFWELFKELSPSPIGSKKEAQAQWSKAVKTDTPETIIDGLKRFFNYHRRQVEAGGFAPNWKHAVRWLRAEQWNDAQAEPTPSPRPPATNPEDTPAARRIREQARQQFLGRHND